MPDLGGTFNPGDHEPRKDFEPLPAGWYAAMITESEIKDTSKGDGQYLRFKITIDSNQHPEIGARVVFDRLNLWNPNTTTVDIAQRTLAAICEAVGHTGELTDSDALNNRRLAIKLVVKPASGNYSASNEVKAYESADKKFGGGTAVPPSPPPAGGGGSSGGKPAWAR